VRNVKSVNKIHHSKTQVKGSNDHTSCERPYVRRLKVGKAVVPAAARAPHARPPPFRPRLGPRDEGAAAPVLPEALKGSWGVCAEPGCMFCRRQQARRGALPTFPLRTSLLRANLEKVHNLNSTAVSLDKKSHLGRIASNRDRTKCKGIVYFCRKFMQNYTSKLPKMAKLVFSVTFGASSSFMMATTIT
jgi:hypothetical protein